jgi:hypothetical protein
MKFLLRLVTFFSYLLLSQQVFAKELVSSFDLMQTDAYSRYTTGNEYIEGQDPGVVMMKVNLWGAVRKPGIHHIPVKTDLISLMSYAGGPNDNAVMDEIIIKRNQGTKQTKFTVDLSQVIHGENNYDLTLQPDDIIVVSAKKPLVSQDSFMLAIIISTIASTVLTAIVIDKTTK